MTCRAWTLKEFDRIALKELTAAIAEQNTEELEQNALDDEPWSEQKYAATLAAQQKEAGLLAGVLAARGITDPTEALTLLAGEEELSDPMLLTDMDKACARILEAIDKEQPKEYKYHDPYDDWIFRQLADIDNRNNIPDTSPQVDFNEADYEDYLKAKWNRGL